MSDKTKIEWCDATWNPVYGCSRVSEGCRHCYAEGLAARFHKPGQWGEGLTRGGKWAGKVTLAEAKMTQPLRWRKPRRIFVNSLSDLFHPNVPDEWIDLIFAVMALCPQHTFIVLTKRPARMREYLSSEETIGRIADAIQPMRKDTHPVGPLPHVEPGDRWWPLPNVWLGVSVEDQPTANERIPDLLATSAAVRIVSAEPLLGPINLTDLDPQGNFHPAGAHGWSAILKNNGIGRAWIDWVICGGESGPHARPMHPDWVRSLRDQCAAAGVPFFFKQWGEFAADEIGPEDARALRFRPGHVEFLKVGKARAGRRFGGRTHDAFPLAKDAAE